MTKLLTQRPWVSQLPRWFVLIASVATAQFFLISKPFAYAQTQSLVDLGPDGLLAAAKKLSIKGMIATAGVAEAIVVYRLSYVMEYSIETAAATDQQNEYFQQVAIIQEGLRQHPFVGSTIVGNEIAQNIKRHPEQKPKLCRLMSEVIVAAPAVAAQMGCSGGGSKPAGNQPTQNGTTSGPRAATGAPDPDDPRFKRKSYQTNTEADAAAKQNGWRYIGRITSRGTKIYFDEESKIYYTRDIDAHNGGAWKGASSPENFESQDRLGTYDRALNRIGK